jgi:hypothetical protein
MAGSVTDPKGPPDHDAAMKNLTPGGTVARARATQRLRNLTIGTTLAGVAASAGFGWLAATTYTGNTGSSSSSNAEVSTATSSAATSATPPSTSSVPSSTNSVSSSTGSAHVSTGGS